MESRIVADFNILWDVIAEQKKGREVYYMPNPGNWGDGLIRSGTLLFFKDKKLKYTTILPQRTKFYYFMRLLFSNPFKQKLLIYGGGGGWTNLWGYPHRLLQSKIFGFYFSKIIVLPSTYEIYLENDKIIYFARDKFESQKNNCKSIFCHDMAFYLMTSLKAKKDKDIDGLKDKGFFFRTDKESKNLFSLPENNIDISLISGYLESHIGFLSMLDKYEVIYTDRLHVAIACCLLNKKLHFWEGSYFKNEAVFKSSIYLFEQKNWRKGKLKI